MDDFRQYLVRTWTPLSGDFEDWINQLSDHRGKPLWPTYRLVSIVPVERSFLQCTFAYARPL